MDRHPISWTQSSRHSVTKIVRDSDLKMIQRWIWTCSDSLKTIESRNSRMFLHEMVSETQLPLRL